ncbi:Quinolone resistance protein NorB [Corynebacterium occultum]|uniref:Quinolone resistance protein NorB n=1 Tax=Corynebacterium occultum TaxID=2675219 RepID=A0A6B8W4B1_9CORY|nr:MFS transporter [Corynebacterium occultum]QGU08384.1 Quinolone resistance protein NorB [Corynebacterium occultum]
MASTTEAKLPESPTPYRGNDRALLGLVLSVITFFLFAQTALNIGPIMGADAGVPAPTMNTAISLAALFTGMFIVLGGNLGDRFGRVRILNLGLIISIIACLLIITAFGPLASPMMLLGRALQGVSSAFIMPTSLALLKTYWEGPARQRAISMWSMGTFGGSGLSAIFGGYLSTTPLGWRSIFIMSILIALIAGLLVRSIPESRPVAASQRKMDYLGLFSLMGTLLAAQVLAAQGFVRGWTDPLILALIALTVIGLFIFIRTERNRENAFVDFSLFKNRSFTGAVIANTLLNASIGVMTVALWTLQFAGGMSPATAGYVTVGYAACVILFIRVGEKMLQKVGPRKPMALGAGIIFIAILMLLPTSLMQLSYVVLATVSFAFYGLGLAFFATPATDTALSSLPEEKAGSGAGVFKMASSLGAAFGVALSSAIFTVVSNSPLPMLGEYVIFSGQQENVLIRTAGMVSVAFNAVLALGALVAILVIIPRQDRDAEQLKKQPHPEHPEQHPGH